MTQAGVETDQDPWPQRHPGLAALGGVLALAVLGWYVVIVLSGEVPSWSYVAMGVVAVAFGFYELYRVWQARQEGHRYRPGVGTAGIGLVALAFVVAAIAQDRWTMALVMSLVAVAAGTVAASGRRRW